MSTNDHKNFEDQQIDLSMLAGKASDFFSSLNRRFFMMIQFLLRHIVVLAVLGIVGVGVGVYFDKTQKSYKNSIIVHPNFESTDYLYAKIELLNSKIAERDTVFLKAIGIKTPSRLLNIEVTPIIDIYKYINSTSTKDNDQSFQIFKLMAEDGDIKKIITDKVTSKNYSFHQIVFNTRGLTRRADIIVPLMNFLENNEFYKKLKVIYSQNMVTKIQKDNEMIAQIDLLLTKFSQDSNASGKSDKLIYYNENTQLSDLLSTKNALIAEIARLQLEIQSVDKIIKENSSTINSLDTKLINGKLKFVFPVVLIFGYLLFFFFFNYYRKQSLIFSQDNQRK